RKLPKEELKNLIKLLEEFKQYYAFPERLPDDLFNKEEVKNFILYNFVLKFIEYSEIFRIKGILKREEFLKVNNAEDFLDELLYTYSNKLDLGKNIWRAISEYTKEIRDKGERTFSERLIDWIDEKILSPKVILSLTLLILIAIAIYRWGLFLSGNFSLLTVGLSLVMVSMVKEGKDIPEIVKEKLFKEVKKKSQKERRKKKEGDETWEDCFDGGRSSLAPQERRRDAIENELEDKREFDGGEKLGELDLIFTLGKTQKMFEDGGRRTQIAKIERFPFYKGMLLTKNDFLVLFALVEKDKLSFDELKDLLKGKLAGWQIEDSLEKIDKNTDFLIQKKNSFSLRGSVRKVLKNYLEDTSWEVNKLLVNLGLPPRFIEFSWENLELGLGVSKEEIDILRRVSSKLPKGLDEKDLAILICIGKGKGTISLVADITGIYTQRSGKKIVEKRFYKLLSKGLIFQGRKRGNYYLNKELETILKKILKEEANEKNLISVLTKEEEVCEEGIEKLISNFKKWEEKLLITENDVKFLWIKSKNISLVQEKFSIPQGSLTHSRRRLAKLGLSKNVKDDGRTRLRLSEKGEELLEHLAEGTLTLDVAWKLGVSRWVEIEGKGIMLREDGPFNDLNEFLDEYHLLLEGIERIKTKPYQGLSERRLKVFCFYYLGIPVRDIARLLDIRQSLVSAYLNDLKEKGIIRKRSEISYELTEEGEKWISAIREKRSPLTDKELEKKIEMVLEETGGNIFETARVLGRSRGELRGIIGRNPQLQKTVERSRIERKKKDELKIVEQEARRKRREEMLLKVKEAMEEAEYNIRKAAGILERQGINIAVRCWVGQLKKSDEQFRQKYEETKR
ncbi:MAG: hypothetical protein DRP81_09660, partial [Candidatus Omnitrophota bacterium]